MGRDRAAPPTGRASAVLGSRSGPDLDPTAAVTGDFYAVARSRRWRIRRAAALCCPARPLRELLRRLHRLRGPPAKHRDHPSRAAGDHGRFQRRAADGGGADQRPDIACAVVAALPVMDWLRTEASTVGKFNIPEYCPWKSGAVPGAAGLFAVPRRGGRDGLPGGLLTAGQHDSRVMPACPEVRPSSSKPRPRPAGAAATGVRRPPGRVDRSGHRQTTDWYAFLFHQVGLGYHPVAPA